MDKQEELKLSAEEVLQVPSTSTAAKLRFTQISDIIRRQKVVDDTEQRTLREQHQKTPSKIKPPMSRLQRSLKEDSLKSSGNSRPFSTQTGSKTSSSRSTNTRVQFFDYNNKFHKQYDQPTSAVEIHEPVTNTEAEMNAMELAALENKSRETKEIEINKLRQQSKERYQKAIEREQVRRGCEELTAKLDALTKQGQLLPSDNRQFAFHRIPQVTKEHETKLNNAVEGILKRPAIITCPLIDRPKPDIAIGAVHQPNTQIDGLNLESAFKQNINNSLNSSDSCGSILLGYVDDHSKQIAYDIQKFKKQHGETDNAKAEKLQNLLNRINKLRENLIKELEQCSVVDVSDKNRVQNMMDSLTDLRKEHENILIHNSAKDSIEARENNLKKKEAVLEKKLREFYEMHKAAEKSNRLNTAQERTEELQNKSKEKDEQKESDEVIRPKKTSKKTVEPNIQNYQASNENSGTVGKQSKKSKKKERRDTNQIIVNEQKESSTSDEEFEEDILGERKLVVGQDPVQIVIKVKSRKTNKIPSKSPRKLSTLIHSPVLKKPRRKLTSVRSIDSNSTSYQSLPSKIQTNADKILKNVPQILKTESEVVSDEESEYSKKKSTNLNPLMAHYVQRLLGMSRTSINALGVTSSDIETPSNSVINTTANLTAAETERLASKRLKNVQKFIEDNYSFIGELEESIRQSNSTDSSLKNVELVWKETLKETKSKKEDPRLKEPLKSSLKKSSKPKKPEFQNEKQPQVDKATQMTDNCTQRIAELTEMIMKVRREKQKILETTLSSTSENGRNSTEYLNLPERHNNSNESSSKILDSQLLKSADILHSKSPETGPRLEKDKITGMSRDSGISLSRPITVQETPESPIDDDLPQVQSSIESLSGQFKKPKPPISIARYSPQLPAEEIPHELSTIFEVDTPATSRLNTSLHAPSVQEQVLKNNDHRNDQITYRQFPTFEKYVRMNNLDMTQFDPEFSIQLEKEFNEFINFARVGKAAEYAEFASFTKYISNSSHSESKEAAVELLASLKLANLSFKRFPTQKEYLAKIGVSDSDLLDSRSFDNLESSKKLNSNSSSESSLLNIEKELQLRDIISKPFQQQPLQRDNGEKGSSSITGSSINVQSRQQADISGIRQFTLISSDEKSTNLEEDLKKMGLKWPSTMKKKTIETQALSSSTSSNFEQSAFTPKRKTFNFTQGSENSMQNKVQTAQDTTTLTEDSGQKLNLREFLKKELLKRTVTSSSLSFSDDSVASSILRSILGSINSSGGQQQPNEVGVPTLDRHKTSTPMASQSISSNKVGSKSHGETSSVQLFSGESRLSSVHFNNNSTDVNKPAVRNG
ncbi:formin-J isoform X2 [Eupeodes corollae]|nr:formin-J isoform X2 [Eupeodes corollae]